MSYISERIGNAVRILSGYAFDSTLFNKEKKGFPIIRVRDVNSGFTGLYYAGEYNPAYIINKGDLLVSLDGNFKCVVWQGEKALLNQRVCKLIPDENKLHKNFLLHILPQKLERIHENTDYTTVKHLSVNIIRSIKIPLPPISDQIKIANVLEKAYTLKSTREENLDLLNMFLKSSFLHFFGDPIRNDKNWNKVQLLNICTKISSGSTPKGGKESYYEEGTSFIRSLNVHNDKFVYDKLAFINKQQAQDLKNVKIEENDILLNLTGASVARCCVVPQNVLPARVNQHVLIIRTHKEIIDSNFLSRLITSDNCQNLLNQKAKSKGATREALTKEDISSFMVILPPKELQNKFSKIVEKSEILIKELEKSLLDLENLIGGLTQKAFNGDLDLDGMDVFLEEYYSSTDNDRTEPSHFEKPINWELVEVKPKKQQEENIKVQNQNFIETDFETILDTLLLKKKNGFQFNEFTDLLSDKEIAFEYEDIRDFIFQQLEQKKLVQYYSSDYWMNDNYKPETSPLQDDFSGTDGNIWLTANTIDK